MEEQVVKADVLCIGGGIAGLMAAIRASELGAKVVVAEKGNTLSSGAGRAGNDHFETYIPEVHGPDINHFVQDLLLGQKGGSLNSREMWLVQFSKAFDIVRLWDRWGIPMKYKGQWEFAGHSFPGRMRTYLKYSGRMQKKILTHQALERGVEVMNRIMVLELLRDEDRVIGAFGLNTREDKSIVFEARSVILGTGSCSRLYPPITPGWMFNDPHAGGTTGDGRAMAYRAGGELRDVEMSTRHIGPKYLTCFGQATWVGVLKDGHGNPVGTFTTKPDRLHGDMIMEVNKLVAEEYTRSGKGPVYMDCTDMTDEDYDYMMHWMVHEGNEALLDHMKDETIDIRRHPIEFATYHMRGGGRIHVNAKAETNVKGLYAGGDETFGGISAAATFGWISGESAARHAQVAETPRAENVRAKIEKKKEWIDQLRGREAGPDWEEVNIALQQVMYDYCGSVRYEKLMEQGLSHLRRIKEKAYGSMVARNPHELMRCLEASNLLDIGEIVFLMALDRKETRRLHVRSDYPFTNPLLNQLHMIQNVDGKPVIGWRKVFN